MRIAFAEYPAIAEIHEEQRRLLALWRAEIVGVFQHVDQRGYHAVQLGLRRWRRQIGGRGLGQAAPL